MGLGVIDRAALEASLTELRSEVADPRAGILGPGSVGWRLGSDLALFLGGGRAALLQLAHPAVAHAIDQQSATRRDIRGRFERTFRAVFAMLFGTLDAACDAARRVHRVHARIHGVLPDGTPYHANDAEALAWVHATLVDTTLVIRELVDRRPLARADKDRYVIELDRFARLFAIPRALRPRDHAEHAAYMARMLAPGVLEVAPCARDLAGFLFGRDPLGRINAAITASLLPAHLAEGFGLSPAPRRVRAGFAAVRALHPLIPPALRRFPAATDAHRRLAGLPPSRVAAWIEAGLARAIDTSRGRDRSA